MILVPRILINVTLLSMNQKLDYPCNPPGCLPVSTSNPPGCLQLREILEISWNLKLLLEVSWKVVDAPGRFYN